MATSQQYLESIARLAIALQGSAEDVLDDYRDELKAIDDQLASIADYLEESAGE